MPVLIGSESHSTQAADFQRPRRALEGGMEGVFSARFVWQNSKTKSATGVFLKIEGFGTGDLTKFRPSSMREIRRDVFAEVHRDSPSNFRENPTFSPLKFLKSSAQFPPRHRRRSSKTTMNSFQTNRLFEQSKSNTTRRAARTAVGLDT